MVKLNQDVSIGSSLHSYFNLKVAQIAQKVAKIATLFRKRLQVVISLRKHAFEDIDKESYGPQTRS